MKNMLILATMVGTGFGFLAGKVSALQQQRVLEDEVARLRKENEELRGAEISRLEKENEELRKALEHPFGELGRAVDVFERGLGTELGRAIDVFEQGVGALTKRFFHEFPVVEFPDTTPDLDRVKDAVAKAVEERGDLGKKVELDAPMQQTYEASSVNGKVTKKVCLVCRAKGDKEVSAIVKVQAKIEDDILCLLDVKLNDKNLLAAADDDDETPASIEL